MILMLFLTELRVYMRQPGSCDSYHTAAKDVGYAKGVLIATFSENHPFMQYALRVSDSTAIRWHFRGRVLPYQRFLLTHANPTCPSELPSVLVLPWASLKSS